MEGTVDKAKVAVEARELFKKWVATLTDEDIDKILGVPPKSRRQEKQEELAKHLEKLTVQMMYGKGVVTNEQLAEAALEWVEKQIPRSSNVPYPSEGSVGYNLALTDVRRDLGLEN